MPTNILRQRRKPAPRPGADRDRSAPRHVLIRVGRIEIRARLLDTPTADRIWQALPLFSTAELRGAELSFETVVESGRERGARMIVSAGEIGFTPDRDAVAIALPPGGPRGTGQPRLWSPSNIWAQALDDLAPLASVRAGEKVEVIRFDNADTSVP
jgi:hypothetical protein